MLTLSYVIGKDQRKLTPFEMHESSEFDLNKDPAVTKNKVQAMQYNSGMDEIFLNLFEEETDSNGKHIPFDMSGANVMFEGWKPDGKYVVDPDIMTPISLQQGQCRINLPAQAFAVYGSYKQAFFRIFRDNKSIATLEFTFEVRADMVQGQIESVDWIGPVHEILEKAKADYESHKKTLDEAVSDAIAEYTKEMNTLKTLGVSVDSSLSGLLQKINDNNLFTQAEAEKFKQEILKLIFKNVQKCRNIAELVADSTLEEGKYVETAGYYDFMDGGGAKYLIVDSKPATPSIALANGLYAELITEDCINIKQLGAKGDGITDDSDVFRQAIALGIPIQVPIGRYKFNSTVELHAKDGDSITIYGSMPISQWNSVTKKPIIISPEDYAFRGLRGKVTSNFQNICFSGYGADALSGSNIINCEFTGHIGLHDFRVSSVTLSSFHDCDIAGLQKSTDSKVINNYFYSNQIGIDYSTSNDDITANNKIEWNKVGINLSNAEDHVINDNIFDRNESYGITMNDFRRSIVTGNFFERNLAAHLQIIKASGIQISTNRFAFKNSEDDGTGTDLPKNALEVADFQNIKFSDSQFSIPSGGKIFKDEPTNSSMVTFDNITANGINLQKLGFYTANSVSFPTGTTTHSWSWTDINTNLGLPDLFHGDDFHVRSTALYLGDKDPNIYAANYHLNVYANFNSLNFMYDNVLISRSNLAMLTHYQSQR